MLSGCTPFERNFLVIPQSARDSHKFRKKGFNFTFKQNPCFLRLEPDKQIWFHARSKDIVSSHFKYAELTKFFLNSFCVSFSVLIVHKGSTISAHTNLGKFAALVCPAIWSLVCTKFRDYAHCKLAQQPAKFQISPKLAFCPYREQPSFKFNMHGPPKMCTEIKVKLVIVESFHWNEIFFIVYWSVKSWRAKEEYIEPSSQATQFNLQLEGTYLGQRPPGIFYAAPPPGNGYAKTFSSWCWCSSISSSSSSFFLWKWICKKLFNLV